MVKKIILFMVLVGLTGGVASAYDWHQTVESGTWRNPDRWSNSSSNPLGWPTDKTDVAVVRNGDTIWMDRGLWGTSTSSTNYLRSLYIGYWMTTADTTLTDDYQSGNGKVLVQSTIDEYPSEPWRVAMLRTRKLSIGESQTNMNVAFTGELELVSGSFRAGNGYFGNAAYIGCNANSTGILTISGGLYEHPDRPGYPCDLHLGREGSTGIVNMSGGKMDLKGENGIHMGAETNDGSGTFTVSGDAEIDANDLVVGEYGDYEFRYVGGTGVYNVDDPNTYKPDISFYGTYNAFKALGSMETSVGSGTARLAWDLRGGYVNPIVVGRTVKLKTGTTISFTGGVQGQTYTLIHLARDAAHHQNEGTPVMEIDAGVLTSCGANYTLSKSTMLWPAASDPYIVDDQTVETLQVYVVNPVNTGCNPELDGDVDGDCDVDMDDHADMANDWLDCDSVPASVFCN